MKSNEFIIEGTNKQLKKLAKKYEMESEDFKTMQEIVNIGKNCKPYLNQVNNPLSLLRGIDGVEDTVIKKRIRLDNRQPLGMSKKTQQILNNYFEENFNAPFRFSMLCTGNMSLADNFGYPYVVFPIGDFKFLWSSKIEDINDVMWENDLDGQEIPITRLLNNANYRTTDINAAIASNNEIMIRANGYYGIRVSHMRNEFPPKLVLKLLKIGMKL